MKDWEAAYIAGIIDGEGSILLTRIHKNEFRRPCITIASTDIELLEFVQSIIGGAIVRKKNYKPTIHKNSFSLNVKSKRDVLNTLKYIYPYLRVEVKKRRAIYILDNYELVTKRNGKYKLEEQINKTKFEEAFFNLK
ncbi:LAGLIDADG family homing endonuclease [Sutcliffiella horikoshii]|uniref:LAGLIDADG family homing endonuclease n=1 Tax=Sutcliffiella horikoshii TaxID=79883 RepID=UPI00384C0FA1